MSLPDPPLLLITDRSQALLPLHEIVRQALEAGCRWLLLREKDLDSETLAAFGKPLAKAARDAGAKFLVSADVNAAVALKADGVHLPRRRAFADAVTEVRNALGPGALVGVSTHNPAEIREANELAVDYMTLSPIYPSISKAGYGSGLGAETLRQYCALATKPVIGLGGVTPERLTDALACGLTGLAVLGAVMQSVEPANEVAAMVTGMQAAHAG